MTEHGPDGVSSPDRGEPDLPDTPTCPFCDGRDTELISPFGSVLSVAGYWCRRCRTGFEYVKWGDPSRPPNPEGERG